MNHELTYTQREREAAGNNSNIQQNNKTSMHSQAAVHIQGEEQEHVTGT